MSKPIILTVDDEPDGYEVISAVLDDLYEVRPAYTGQAALDSVRQSPPDLILLDVRLPDLNGYEICARLKADPATAGIPIIFVSALDDPLDETLGLELGATDYVAKPFSAATLRARIRLHLEAKQLREELQQMATSDALTGLANRRQFDETLLHEVQRHRRTHSPLSLVLLDIDHFKHFNDRFGHPAGDSCLREVASALATTVHRPGDLAARVGGEEFACLLPDTDHHGALRLAEEIRAAIRSRAIQVDADADAEYVTASLGVATLSSDSEQDGAALYQAADARLYHAKQHGRNRVVGELAGTASVAGTQPSSPSV